MAKVTALVHKQAYAEVLGLDAKLLRKLTDIDFRRQDFHEHSSGTIRKMLSRALGYAIDGHEVDAIDAILRFCKFHLLTLTIQQKSLETLILTGAHEPLMLLMNGQV